MFLSSQTKRVHWVCLPHPSAVLASSGLADPLCPASGLHLLHAHPSRCGLPHCWSSDCDPHWLSRTIQGLPTAPPISKVYLWLPTDLCVILFLRHLSCTCALSSTPLCLLNFGPSTASRQLLLQLYRTRTRLSSPPLPSSLALSSGVVLHPVSCSSWPITKWSVLLLSFVNPSKEGMWWRNSVCLLNLKYEEASKVYIWKTTVRCVFSDGGDGLSSRH